MAVPAFLEAFNNVTKNTKAKPKPKGKSKGKGKSSKKGC